MGLSGELFSRQTKLEHFDYGASVKAIINKNVSSQVSSLVITVLLPELAAFAVHALRPVLSLLLVVCVRNTCQRGSCLTVCQKLLCNYCQAREHRCVRICYEVGQLRRISVSVVERRKL